MPKTYRGKSSIAIERSTYCSVILNTTRLFRRFYLLLRFFACNQRNCRDSDDQQCQCSVGNAFRYMQTFGVEAHFNGMLAGRDIQGAQYIIRTSQSGRFPVNGYLPAVRVVYLGEYGNAVSRVFRFVNQAVGFIARQADGGKAVFMSL